MIEFSSHNEAVPSGVSMSTSRGRRVGRAALLTLFAATGLAACSDAAEPLAAPTSAAVDAPLQELLPPGDLASVVGDRGAVLAEAEPNTEMVQGNPDAPTEAPELLAAAEDAGADLVADVPTVLEEPEVDLEDAPVVPQQGVAVGASAMCATVQIGHDAVVDGAGDVAATQRDLIVDRGARVQDAELGELLSSIGADDSLELDVITRALERCEVLGFEL